jgi:hypothetical protein
VVDIAAHAEQTVSTASPCDVLELVMIAREEPVWLG